MPQAVSAHNSTFFTLPVMHAPFFSGQGAGGVLSSFSQCSRPVGQPQSDLHSLIQLSAAKLGSPAAASSAAHAPLGPVSDALRAISDAPTRTPSPPEAHADEAATSNNTIFPRRKAGERTRVNSKPVVLNDAILRQLFTLPLHEAAVRLGISATAMKSACRKLGIKKWPYRSSYGVKNASSRNGAQSGSDTSALTSPTCSSTTSASGAMSKFPGAGSGSRSASPSGKTGETSSVLHSDTERDRDMERDSLSRDAALLAETMLLLQQGVSRAQAEGRSSAAASSCSPPPAKKPKKRKLNVCVKTEDSAASSDTQGSHSTSSSVASSSVRGGNSPSPEPEAPPATVTAASASWAGTASVASLLN